MMHHLYVARVKMVAADVRRFSSQKPPCELLVLQFHSRELADEVLNFSANPNNIRPLAHFCFIPVNANEWHQKEANCGFLGNRGQLRLRLKTLSPRRRSGGAVADVHTKEYFELGRGVIKDISGLQPLAGSTGSPSAVRGKPGRTRKSANI
jgi:hypothetical protein